MDNGPGTGYEAAKLAGVPRSKVYGALESLVRRGLVMVTQGEKSKLYCAESKERVIKVLEREGRATLNSLQNALGAYNAKTQGQYIWSFSAYSMLEVRTSELIKEAQTEILLQIWVEELSPELETLLLQKQAAGVKVLVVLYDAEQRYRTQIKAVYKHGFEADKLEELGGRWLNLTVDGKEMLYAAIKTADTVAQTPASALTGTSSASDAATTTPDAATTRTCDAIYTEHSGMVFFAKEYIMHDAYCLRLIDRLQDNVKTAFGADMEGIRNVFDINK